jgi:hypothetical protein
LEWEIEGDSSGGDDEFWVFVLLGDFGREAAFEGVAGHDCDVTDEAPIGFCPCEGT